MFGTLNESEIENLVSNQILARLGCHHNEVTYVVPISYAYDGTNIYCHSYEGMKTEMMRSNPHVCLQIDDMKNMADWKSVVCWGEARELKNEVEREEAIKFLVSRKLPLESSETTHLFSHWPFSGENEEKLPGVLFCIKINKKTGRFERTISQDQRQVRS